MYHKYAFASIIIIYFFVINPAIGGASQHNSMPVPSPEKWGGKPENPA